MIHTIIISILVITITSAVWGLITYKFISRMHNEHYEDKTLQRLTYEKTIAQYEKNTNALQQMVSAESTSKVHFRNRVNELEASIQKGTGVKLRVDQTVIKTQFNKEEMATILYSVQADTKNHTNNLEDLKYFVALIEKIQSYVKKMYDAEDRTIISVEDDDKKTKDRGLFL